MTPQCQSFSSGLSPAREPPLVARMSKKKKPALWIATVRANLKEFIYRRKCSKRGSMMRACSNRGATMTAGGAQYPATQTPLGA